MCTVVLFYKQLKDYPIIIAHNRDALAESVERSPSALTPDARVFGPRDMKSGGTWIGLNQACLLLALTNRYQPNRDEYPADMSRGTLVLTILEQAENSKKAVELAREICSARRLKYFNLFLADDHDLHRIEYDEHMNAAKLEPGRYFHSSSGYDVGTIRTQREDRLHQLLQDFEPVSLRDCLTELEAVCGDHYEKNTPSETSICMHGTRRRTTSSTVFAISKSGNYGDIVCEQVNGYPCQNEYRRFPIG
jgi:uncharacterized protein with NRDE domain